MNPKIHPIANVSTLHSTRTSHRRHIDYGTYCTACHGPDAQGLEGVGPNLLISENVQNWSDAELHTFIVNGRAAIIQTMYPAIVLRCQPRVGFPNLRDDQIDNIIAFLRVRADE
jgi:cytochrome c2